MPITYTRNVPKTTEITKEEAQDMIKEVRIWQNRSVDVYFDTWGSMVYRAYSIDIDADQNQKFQEDEDALWQFAKDNIPEDLHISTI